MKKQLLFAGLLVLGLADASAQCITMAGPSAIGVNTQSGVCGAAVTYAATTATSTCAAYISDTLQYTGAVQTFVVPAGTTTVRIETWGAQGGANWVNNNNFGGYTKAEFAVTPGETLYVYVGQQPNGVTGGFNGGGNGDGSGQAGGGATDVRRGGSTLADRIIVAGAGGGAGYWSSLHVVGGAGGGLTGGNGYREPDFVANPGGEGGTQTASGNGTCVTFSNPAMAGGFGFGGAPSGCGCEGYGGGGGWWGGAGSGNCRGGGGGSSYVLPTATDTMMLRGVRAGNGMAVISTPVITTATITQTAGLASGAVFPVGITTNTFLADDGFGNTGTRSFTITVTDTEAPVITSLPAHISVATDNGQCEAVVSWAAAVATDNCTATLSADHNSGDAFPLGTTTVLYTATDAAGNTDTASFTITVTDTEAPVVTAPAAVLAIADAGACGTSAVTLGTATATDNCAVLSTTSDAPAIFPVGNTTVTWTGTDIHGNTATATQTVTVTDSEAPVFTSSASLAACEGIINFSDPEATDNCSGVTVVHVSGPQSGDPLTAGTYTAEYTATDASGNTTPFSLTITVNAAPAVGLTLSIPPVVCIGSGTYTLTPGTPAGGIFSGNGVSGFTFDPAAAGAGVQTITYSYTNTDGCEGSASGTVNVDLCLGIDEAGRTTFQLYPNPASGAFWFISDDNGTLELMDLTGKLVQQEKIQSARQQITLKNVNAGVYMVRFSSAKGISTARLVINP